jgi:fructose-1,6-bisphosphatase II
MDRNLALELIRTAEATALSSTRGMEKGTVGVAEGVLAPAVPLRIGGEIQTRLIPGNAEEVEQASSAGFSDPGHLYASADLARGKSINFAAPGVTDGDLLNGVRYRPDGATTHSPVVRQSTGTRRFVTTEHYFEYEPQY